MTFHNNNSAAIGVGVAIFIVVIIIIIVVAFGCNGGWFGRCGVNGGQSPAYVALAQKKKQKVTDTDTEAAPPASRQQEVVLAQTTHAEPACAVQGADDTVQASFDDKMYQEDATVEAVDESDPSKMSKDLDNFFPRQNKDFESISGGDTGDIDTSAMDGNKITLKELKQRYTMQGWVDRFQFSSRNGATRTLGMSSSLLRPWYDDFVAAQKRACARRERKQSKGCDDDDTCVQFNESSFMYDACDQ